METQPIIATHAEDPDGIIAHALLMRALDISTITPSSDAHHFLRYDTLPQDFETINSLLTQTPSDLYIADIAFNDSLVTARDGQLVQDVAKNASTVTWFDHHENTKRKIPLLEDFGVNVVYNHQSSGLQVQRHYRLNEAYEVLLGRIAHGHDHKKVGSTHRNILLGDELQSIITLANVDNPKLLMDLAIDLRDENCFDDYQLKPHWRSVADESKSQQEKAIGILEKCLEFETVAGQRVLWAETSPYLSSKPGPRYLMEHYGDQFDLCVSLFGHPVRNHIIDGKPKSDFPIQDLCQSLGGGGRGKSGGFSLPESLQSPVEIESAKELIKEKIKYYSRPA
ncbi:hypothetical protein HQ489_01320 [Candidatus Woesearchaeota archaeon]|nr:hypothetical protein [Candidatus Woesearchaeota archaeon]